jgi:hypothetical protein
MGDPPSGVRCDDVVVVIESRSKAPQSVHESALWPRLNGGSVTFTSARQVMPLWKCPSASLQILAHEVSGLSHRPHEALHPSMGDYPARLIDSRAANPMRHINVRAWE